MKVPLPLTLPNPQQTVEEITTFLTATVKAQQAEKVVIAVSGGIDSAVVLTLLTKSLPKTVIYPVLLPYGTQATNDSYLICTWNKLTESQITEINIQPLVASFLKQLNITPQNTLRKGNIAARVRMIITYDLAKKYNALVCGTENKSEKHLGYFTRFGDEASDIEPIQHLYKTQVRQLARYLQLPETFLTKPPSAELWENQTDETELGFSYETADQVLYQLIDESKPVEKIEVSGISNEIVQEVVSTVRFQAFKHNVPYHVM